MLSTSIRLRLPPGLCRHRLSDRIRAHTRAFLKSEQFRGMTTGHSGFFFDMEPPPEGLRPPQGHPGRLAYNFTFIYRLLSTRNQGLFLN